MIFEIILFIEEVLISCVLIGGAPLKCMCDVSDKLRHLFPSLQPTDSPSPSLAMYDAEIQFSSNLTNDSDTPFSVLSFVGGALLSWEQIQVTESPGFLEIINVTNVEISLSSFRYFVLLGVYNTHYVIALGAHSEAGFRVFTSFRM